MNWQEIREEFETTDISLKDLAEKHGIKEGTLKSRKSREKWEKRNVKKGATKKKKDATKAPKVATSGAAADQSDLNDKQELFCIYYIKYHNATKAYLKAYESAYSTAAVNGHKLLRNAKVTARIDELKAEQLQEVKFSARDVLQKYIDIANADITDFVKFGEKDRERNEIMGYGPDDEPIMVPTKTKEAYFELRNDDEIDGTIVTEIKYGPNGPSVKLADRMKALEKLERYTDLFNEREMEQLRVEKIKAETAKLHAEAKTEEGAGNVYIVQNKDAMREAMRARSAAKEEAEA